MKRIENFRRQSAPPGGSDSWHAGGASEKKLDFLSVFLIFLSFLGRFILKPCCFYLDCSDNAGKFFILSLTFFWYLIQILMWNLVIRLEDFSKQIKSNISFQPGCLLSKSKEFTLNDWQFWHIKMLHFCAQLRMLHRWNNKWRFLLYIT